MLLIQKLGRALFNIGGVLMAALLVWAGPVMAEETLPAEAASGVETDAKSAPCKGLKPYNNIDELLYHPYEGDLPLVKNDQIELIDQLMGKQLSKEEFAELFFKAEDNRSPFILKLLENAFVRKNSDDVECCMYVAFVFDLFSLEYIPILSKLLAEDWHIGHEDIALLLQKFRRPETIEVLYKTALRKFKYLDCNDSSALAVKCIWALGDIGTKAAETKLELLAKSDNEIIRDNAVYQLTGLGRTWKDE